MDAKNHDWSLCARFEVLRMQTLTWYTQLVFSEARSAANGAPRTRRFGVADAREVFNLAALRALPRLRRHAPFAASNRGF